MRGRRLVRWLLKTAGFGGPVTTAHRQGLPVAFLVLADGHVLHLTPTIQKDRDVVWQCMQRLMRSSTATEKTSSDQPSTSPESPVSTATS